MGQYWGFVQLGSALDGVVLTRDGSNTPKDSSTAPTYRVYGPSGLMTNGTGTLTAKDPSSSGGPVTAATNASPVQITSANHGLTTGTRVTVAGVGGNTGANGDFNVTVVDPNNFTLTGSTGNGAYTSGGTWHVSGLYDFNITPTGGNGYLQGTTYSVLVTAVVGGTTVAQLCTFTCV